jgi:DNA-binding IclR family transcriptional regulator
MSQSPAQFAVRTLRALEVLAFTPATAPQLADALGIHPKVARRLLSQLQRDGWLSCADGTQRLYAPTLRFVALAAEIGSRSPLATLAEPEVQYLHASTGLEATLLIPSYRGTVCIVRCVGERTIHPAPSGVAPAHCTAPGKVLMAYRDAWRESILAAAPLQRCTSRSVTDTHVLKLELARVRRDGYAVEDSENVDGRRQLAAPITGPEGDDVAALALAANDSQPLDGLAEKVVHAAGIASEALRLGARRYPLRRGIVFRLLGSYGLTPVDARL